MPDNQRPGATGRFPEGKLNPGDEGELRLAVGREGDKIIIAFGKPVAWIGMTPKEAAELAGLLLRHAGGFRIEGRNGNG